MTEFVSSIKEIPCNDERIFGTLSDLSNLERIKKLVRAEDKLADFSFEHDSFSFSVDPVGKVRFRIVDREPNKTIKFVMDNSSIPIPIEILVQMSHVAENETRMKVTLFTELNPLARRVFSNPLQSAVDKIAKTLASLPY